MTSDENLIKIDLISDQTAGVHTTCEKGRQVIFFLLHYNKCKSTFRNHTKMNFIDYNPIRDYNSLQNISAPGCALA